MSERIKTMLSVVTNDQNLQTQVKSDIWQTLENIWFDTNKIDSVLSNFFDRIESMLIQHNSVQEIELALNQVLKDNWVVQHFRWAQKDRVKNIDEQIWHMIPINKTWVDYWTWHGEIAKLMQEKYWWDILAIDVVDYRVEWAKQIPFEQFDGWTIPSNKKFEYWVLTNVAHHELNNEKIIEELSRKVRETLIVIETVPNLDLWKFSERIFRKHLPEAKTDLSKQILKKYLKEIKFDNTLEDEASERNIRNAWLRNHANDWWRNRMITDPKIQVPVPWTYEHWLWWLIRFWNHWRIPSEIVDYWYDMKGIKDKHVWYKFERQEWHQRKELPKFQKQYKRQNEIYWGEIQ